MCCNKSNILRPLKGRLSEASCLTFGSQDPVAKPWGGPGLFVLFVLSQGNSPSLVLLWT